MPDRVRHDENRTVLIWDRAKARFHKAEAALELVAHTEDDDAYDRRLLAFNAALRRLLKTPAPGPAALADKLDLLVAHEFWEITGAESCLAAMKRDARRFAAA